MGMFIPSYGVPEVYVAAARSRPLASTLDHEKALDCAAEYRRLTERGDDAQEICKAIDRLVGKWVSGRLCWPRTVADAAGAPERMLRVSVPVCAMGEVR